MPGLKKRIKRVLALVPPFGRLFAEIDALRLENPELKQQLADSRRENDMLRLDLAKLTDEVAMSWRETEVTLEKWRAVVSELEEMKRSVWVRPGHFYSPIPAIRDLKVNEDDVFGVPPAIRGIDLNEAGQVELLKEFAELYP